MERIETKVTIKLDSEDVRKAIADYIRQKEELIKKDELIENVIFTDDNLNVVHNVHIEVRLMNYKEEDLPF